MLQFAQTPNIREIHLSIHNTAINEYFIVCIASVSKVHPPLSGYKLSSSLCAIMNVSDGKKCSLSPPGKPYMVRFSLTSHR